MDQISAIGTIITLVLSTVFGFMGINAYSDNGDDVAANEALNVLTPSTDNKDFHDMIIDNADQVNNAVTAMRAGNENPADVMTIINRKASDAQRDTTYTTEQRAINKEYKTFLDIAGIVVNDYVTHSDKLDSDVNALKDQYNRI